MGSPILSQDEIEALLHRGNTHSPSAELQELLKLVAESTTARVSGISSEPFDMEGPYIERLGKSLELSFVDEALVVAIDLGQSDILVLMNAGDANVLAGHLRISGEEVMQMVSQAWTTEMARLIGGPYQAYQVQRVSSTALGQLKIKAPAYLVRHMFKCQSQRIEFCLIIQDSDKFEALAARAVEKISLVQAKLSTKGGLLKRNNDQSPVTRAVFTPIDDVARLQGEQDMALLEDIDLTVTVELGQTKLTLKEILELQPQSVISLERHAGEPVDVFVNDTRVAKAEVVVLEENFGVRILEIVPKSQRIRGE
jgi:flagellar motor switch protein FliN